jgi:hypothetical protein
VEVIAGHIAAVPIEYDHDPSSCTASRAPWRRFEKAAARRIAGALLRRLGHPRPSGHGQKTDSQRGQCTPRSVLSNSPQRSALAWSLLGATANRPVPSVSCQSIGCMPRGDHLPLADTTNHHFECVRSGISKQSRCCRAPSDSSSSKGRGMDSTSLSRAYRSSRLNVDSAPSRNSRRCLVGSQRL